MNKFTTFSILIFLPIMVFAADFSISTGGGAFGGYTFTRYTLSGDDLSGKFVESKQRMDRVNFGGFVFLDLTYAMFSVSYQASNNKYRESVQYPDGSFLTDDIGKGKEQSFNLSLLGKYPFTINRKLQMYPIFGLEYHFALVQKRKPDDSKIWYDRHKGGLKADRNKDDKPYKLSAWNSIWLTVGGGADLYLVKNLFLRTEVHFSFRMPTTYEMGALEVVKQEPTNIKDPKMGGLTGTPTLRLSIGYRFYDKPKK